MSTRSGPYALRNQARVSAWTGATSSRISISARPAPPLTSGGTTVPYPVSMSSWTEAR